MKLTSLRLDLIRPEHQGIVEMRRWVHQQLHPHGQPLRWAITGLAVNAARQQCVQVEAVVLTPTVDTP